MTGNTGAAQGRHSTPRLRMNPLVGETLPEPSCLARDWHRSLPGYTATSLHDIQGIAAAIGLDHMWVKDETRRFGLPAFKILGVSWATEVVLARRAEPVTRFVAATDGNHGRAVARVARQRGYAATIFVPAGSSAARIDAIRAEGRRRSRRRALRGRGERAGRQQPADQPVPPVRADIRFTVGSTAGLSPRCRSTGPAGCLQWC